MNDCIVILCPNLNKAHETFIKFLNYIDDLYPLECSEEIDEYANIIDTYHGMRYIFCDENMSFAYEGVSSDFVYYDEFLEGMP